VLAELGSRNIGIYVGRFLMVRRRVVLASLCVVVGLLAVTKPARAWTPYTHLFTANLARDAVLRDGGITINGHLYPLRPEVLEAITNFPLAFNGGVVGPDGMPDITYGQAVIHPNHTGKWLRHILSNAWSTYRARGGDAEAQKILAFSYGYLAHGAGDMWAHTYVNDFAQHVFPSVTDIFKNLVKIPPTSDNTRDLATALRHLVAEGYAGDATPGYDGDPEPGPAPGRDCPADNPNCKRAPRSTPFYDLDAPNRFVYDTLINPNVTMPVADTSGPAPDHASRGPVIDFFLGMRQGLIGAGAALDPDPLGLLRDVADTFTSTVNRVHAVEDACSEGLDDCIESFLENLGGELLDLLDLGLDGILELLKDTIGQAAKPFVNAYLGAWVADIDDGLVHWNELGLGFSKAAFDPQVRREIMYEDCDSLFGEANRDACKEGIGLQKALLDPISESGVNDFINHHLLSMLGFPDLVGELREAFQDALEFIESAICDTPLLDLVCDLEKTVVEEVQRLAEKLVQAFVKEVFGIDLEALENLDKNLGAFMPLEQLLPGDIASSIFGPGASGGINFFLPGSHDRADGYLGLGPDHHEPAAEPIVGFPIPWERLTAEAEYSPDFFAPAKNTILQEKLLMLDGAGLNNLMRDTLFDGHVIKSGVTITTFEDGPVVPANIMVSALKMSPSDSPDPWLLLIDGDHAWRQDGLPRFCTPSSTGDVHPCPSRPAALGPVSTRFDLAKDPVGGNGRFPMWESCLLRPAFKTLYKDWENGVLNFPDLEDGASPDPTDPNAPALSLNAGTPKFQSGATLFVGPATPFILTATEDVFDTSQVDLRYRMTAGATSSGDFTQVNGTLAAPSFGLPADAVEGPWIVEAQSEDLCHTFAVESPDVLLPGDTSLSVVLDKTPPVITITSPTATTYDTASLVPVTATADDGPTGSGVASLTATLDGNPVAIGSSIDTFLLAPGEHTVTYTAADNVANTSTASVTFRILATPQSLLANLDRARAAGQFPGDPLFKNVRKHIAKALDEQAAGHLNSSFGELNAALSELEAGRNRNDGEVDPHVADLLIASISELIATMGHTNLDSHNTSLGVLEKLEGAYVAGNVSAHGAYEQLRQQITQAVGDHFAGQRTQEINDLNGFINRVALLLSKNSSPCASHELACFQIDAGAAGGLTTAAQSARDAL